jgi:choline monooxygenase
VVVRHPTGELRAFHNVCRHHAAEVCLGEGRADQLVCPYHRWTYDLDGRLASAPELGAARGFDRAAFALPPLAVHALEPFVFVSAADEPWDMDVELAELAARLEAMDTGRLAFVKRVSYEIACNWKVFVDNYLDGGYHIAHLHRGLADELDMASYRTELLGRLSIQSSGGGEGARVDWGALYAFVHPNFMINRYGPWMDTNLVLPLGHDRCEVVMEYWLDPAAGGDDPEFVERSLADSWRIHLEDVAISESVQRGVASRSYDRGRYSVAREGAMHLFHRNLAADLAGDPTWRA